jgi:shikimate kinase
VTILVDAPTWPWRGRLWAHVTSDVSMRELHLFAEQLEIPRRGFGGDHYDVPEEYVPRVVATGAVVVTGRELVARLTSAGLRRRRTAPVLAPRVVLVGLMGSGKTTVGKVVAARTGWTYVDNDAVLARLAGRPLAEAAKQLGWDGLHDLEIECLRTILDMPAPLVAGAAASVIDRVEGRALLREAYVVYLRAHVETLVARVGDGAGRPWLDGDAEGFIRKQTEERGPAFERAADLIVDVDADNPQASAAQVLTALGGVLEGG